METHNNRVLLIHNQTSPHNDQQPNRSDKISCQTNKFPKSAQDLDLELFRSNCMLYRMQKNWVKSNCWLLIILESFSVQMGWRTKLVIGAAITENHLRKKLSPKPMWAPHLVHFFNGDVLRLREEQGDENGHYDLKAGEEEEEAKLQVAEQRKK